MDNYKYSEDCFKQKRKFDELIEQVPYKTEYIPIKNFNSFIEQFHDYNQIPLEEIPNAFQFAEEYIQYFPEREKESLFQNIESSPLRSDCIIYFHDMCEAGKFLQIHENYFKLLSTITRTSSLFSDSEEYFSFVIYLAIQQENFPDKAKNLINIIINNMVISCQNPELLNILYSSPQHEQLLEMAINPKENDIFCVKSSSQKVIENLYSNIMKYTKEFDKSENNEETAEKAKEILSNFFNIHKENGYYDGYFLNDEFIIHVSISILKECPEAFVIIYEDNHEYFKSLFTNRYLQIDKSISFFAFHLIIQIMQNLERENPPDLDDILDWNDIIRFLIVRKMGSSESIAFKKMLLFSAAYLRFGSAFFDKFYSHQFFHELLEMMHQRQLNFSETIIATKCLTAAINFSGSQTQIYYLFKEEEVLPVLLSVLENDSDEDLTRDILFSIEIIWEVCQNSIENDLIPSNAADEFTTCFREESGYEILIGLKTCPEEVRRLNELIDDPPKLDPEED